jgi:predicted ATPase
MEARERVVGRHDELAAVRRVVEQARRGLSNLLVVEGEAGIGKSTILDAGVRDAQGVILLRARGRELERDRPFGLVASTLGPPAADLVRSISIPAATAAR